MSGPAAGSEGPFLISYTEFTPHTLRDVPRIHLAAERLRKECATLEGAVGVLAYWQLLRRRVGSLSAWEDEEALRRFIRLPYHLDIMREFRARGTLRAAKWRSRSFELAPAFADGQAQLDAAG